jgi:hypothetical protein
LLFDVLFSSPGSPPFDLTDGVVAIRLEACADKDTPFAPAMLPIGAQCVPIDVYDPSARVPTRIVLSFGAGRCPQVVPDFTG